jgi:4-diphosphocytidyl-2-C-methyl-D-erythritol kinase
MSTNQDIWLAPAKLNLFLHITAQRSDGYHELQTLFQLLDYGDELQFTANHSAALSLHLLADSEITNIPLDGNLIVAAARLLRDHAGDPSLGASIQLRKRIPIGAGLGGGSSDAATTLTALNQLWELGLDASTLQQLGLQLGADVPVFLLGKSSWGEGVGERLEPVKLPSRWYLVLTPACEVSTAQLFAQQDLTRNSPTIKIADFLAGRSRNDCESSTRKLYPQVDEAMNWLGQHAEPRMTGTGSSVFAAFEDQASAQAVLELLPAGMSGFVAEGVNSLERHNFAA